jgi:hypothetical protein
MEEMQAPACRSPVVVLGRAGVPPGALPTPECTRGLVLSPCFSLFQPASPAQIAWRFAGNAATVALAAIYAEDTETHTYFERRVCVACCCRMIVR